jgi:N-methylhydantoinase A/acetophenone carboxylase
VYKVATHPAPADSERYELSIDTGGTFTDGFVRSRSRTAQVKVDTTPYDPTVGFSDCVAAAAEAMGESLSAFLRKTDRVHFSSTIATNVAVQRSGAKVGLIVTAGEEKTLFGSPDEALALQGLLPGEVVRGVTEEVDDLGVVITPVDAEGLEQAVRELLEMGVQIIVVSFARSHWNAHNEREARAIIERSYPKHYLGATHLMLSTEVSLVADDFGRTALAVANAYIHPSLSRSLYRADDVVRSAGHRSPLLIVNTDGSNTRVAKTRAIDTFNSGPTSGALGAAIVAEALGAEHVVTFDVGGTTTDVAYLRGGVADRTEATDFGDGLSLPHSAVSLASFGLGGGSILSASEGAISVGPTSAGAIPGPACFGLGGQDATPTDVWLATGYLEAGDFLGGRRRLEPSFAHEALGRLASELHSEPERTVLAARDAIRQTLTKYLVTWADRHDELRAASPGSRWLFSYGGGAGLLCTEAAEALGIENVVVFPHSSVFSAFGGSLLPIAHKYESLVEDGSDREMVEVACRRLLDRAQRDLRTEGVAAEESIDVELRLAPFDGHSGRSERMSRPRGELMDVSVLGTPGLVQSATRCRLSLGVVVPRDRELHATLADGRVGADSSRTVLTDAGRQELRVVTGLGRASAGSVDGPCFLAAPDTTIVVHQGWRVEFDRHGYGILRTGESR